MNKELKKKTGILQEEIQKLYFDFMEDTGFYPVLNIDYIRAINGTVVRVIISNDGYLISDK